MDETTAKQASFLAFFAQPIVGIAGSIASIIGIALSIYFFMVSREVPELTYFVHPAKAAVVRSGQTSGLTVMFDGQNLNGDITATQIAIWNAGRKSVRSENILQPLVIRTTNHAKILEARVQKVTRDVVGLSLDTSRLSFGEVGVSWNILEQNDGGVVQIIYAGNERTGIEANAVLERQAKILCQEYNSSISSPGEEYSRHQGWEGRYFIYMPALTAFVIFVNLSLVIHKRRKVGLGWSRPYWVVIICIILLIGMSVWALLYNSAGPPFGF